MSSDGVEEWGRLDLVLFTGIRAMMLIGAPLIVWWAYDWIVAGILLTAQLLWILLYESDLEEIYRANMKRVLGVNRGESR